MRPGAIFITYNWSVYEHGTLALLGNGSGAAKAAPQCAGHAGGRPWHARQAARVTDALVAVL